MQGYLYSNSNLLCYSGLWYNWGVNMVTMISNPSNFDHCRAETTELSVKMYILTGEHGCWWKKDIIPRP